MGRLKSGWVPDAHDHRDLKAEHQEFLMAALPSALPRLVDLRPKMPAIYDQGQLGSCTANAIAAALQYDWIIQGKPNAFVPSRLAIYYLERLIEGTVGQDAGAQIRDGAKAMNKYGFFSESLWPYDTTKFAVHPPSSALAIASHERVTSYARVTQTAHAIKTVLAAGRPIVFGFNVGSSFEGPHVASTGHWVPIDGEEILGGHAVLMVGYDDSDKTALVRNSWGNRWGLKGHFKVPLSWLCDPNNASDFWVFYSVP